MGLGDRSQDSALTGDLSFPCHLSACSLSSYQTASLTVTNAAPPASLTTAWGRHSSTEVRGCGLGGKGVGAGPGGGPSDAPVPLDVPMDEASDYSEADKSSLMDESDDSGVIPGSHSENALHASEEEEGEGGEAQRYPAHPRGKALPLAKMGWHRPVNLLGTHTFIFQRYLFS